MAPAGYHAPSAPALLLGCPPGPRLDARVDDAVALWRRGEVSLLVVSGAGEAGVAAQRCLAAGVPRDRVVVEPRARTTWENLVYTRALTGPGPLWLVSDGWHLPRAAAMARRLGYVPRVHPVSIRTPVATTFRALARELGAWGVAAWRRQLY